jgi:hypothetical protein
MGISPMAVRDRENELRRALFESLTRAVDDERALVRALEKNCAALRPELARLLLDGKSKRTDEVLAHARACKACRALYDGFAIIEPTDSVLTQSPLDGDGSFRPDIDMHVPPRLAARIRSVIPADASEEVPFFARASGHLVTLVALTVAAMVAVAVVTTETPERASRHVVEKPVVSMRVACVTGEGSERAVFVVDETLPVSIEEGVRHDCPRGSALSVTAKASVAGRVLVRADDDVTFGPDALDGQTMRALTGTFALHGAPSSQVALRLVFVAGDVDDDIVLARAEHPQPQDVVIERTVRVADAP